MVINPHSVILSGYNGSLLYMFARPFDPEGMHGSYPWYCSSTPSADPYILAGISSTALWWDYFLVVTYAEYRKLFHFSTFNVVSSALHKAARHSAFWIISLDFGRRLRWFIAVHPESQQKEIRDVLAGSPGMRCRCVIGRFRLCSTPAWQRFLNCCSLISTLSFGGLVRNPLLHSISRHVSGDASPSMPTVVLFILVRRTLFWEAVSNNNSKSGVNSG